MSALPGGLGLPGGRLGDVVQGYAEVVAVGGQQRVVAG